MALTSVALDDLSWAALVEASRRRIAGASGGQWTLHAPVDPGVTLLELIAWLLEQRVYWMDQVPDVLVRRILTLLGDAPRATAVAATVLQLSDRGGQPRVVAGGTVMSVPGRPRVKFSTATSLHVLPVADVGVVATGRDKSADLDARRRVILFPASSNAGDARIELWMPQRPSQTVARAALLLELDADASIAPEWASDAVSVPKPAAVTWWYRGAGGILRRFPGGDLRDGTRGLRRSGLVRFRVPTDWTADQPPDGRGLQPFSLTLRVARCSFDAPPRLVQLVPNAVIARHRRQVRPAAMTLDWLPLPGNAMVLEESERDVLESTPRLRLNEQAAGWHAWVPTADLGLHGPADRVFMVDRQFGALRFGNGITGRVPSLDRRGAPNVVLVYEAGGGPDGNVAAGGAPGASEWSGAISSAVAVTNPVPARGGAHAEGIAAARERVASARRQPSRAVTRADYVTLALTTPGVAIGRAHAAIGLAPSLPCPVPGAVTVFVLPRVAREGDRADREPRRVAFPVTDPGALRAVRRRLNAARLIGTELYVRSAQYTDVRLRIDTHGDAEATEELRQSVIADLTQYLDPLEGGDTQDGWPFGGALRPSALLRRAQAAAGELAVVDSVTILIGTISEDCRDVLPPPHHLPALREVLVVHRRAPRAQGGMR